MDTRSSPCEIHRVYKQNIIASLTGKSARVYTGGWYAVGGGARAGAARDTGNHPGRCTLASSVARPTVHLSIPTSDV